MQITKLRAAPFLFALALATTGCVENDTVEPKFTPPGGDLFFRYVALGNSITAGFQSGGINVTLQRQAYPVLLAGKAGADFHVPAINDPGCPPPFVAPLTTERIADSDCLARSVNAPRLVQNLAVPGAAMEDATNFTGPGLSFLTTLILGGVDQATAMVNAEPTLVSVWLGNNDALGAALLGEPTALTPQSAFQADLDALVAAIDASTAETAVLIGVVDAMAAAPALQPGAWFWLLDQSGLSPIPLTVDASCDPATSPATAFNLVSLVGLLGAYGDQPSIPVSCADDALFVLNAAEQVTIASAVAAFNTAIADAADANGWIYIDPGSLFTPALADPDLIRKCQGLQSALASGDPVQINAAMVNTCPHESAPNFFGSWISYDAVHPSSVAHQAVADAMADALNAELGSSLP